MRDDNNANGFKRSEGRFTSSDKKNTIAYYIYTPTQQPRAVFQIAHGMVEHFGRYAEFAEYLACRGIVVCGNDHLGHGHSAASDDDLGYFGGADADVIVDDMLALHDIMRQKYRRLPYILLGHSMGSFLARSFIVKYGDRLDGAVICGTGGTNKRLGFGIFMSSLIAALRGGRYRSKFLFSQSNGGLNNAFKNEHESAWLTKDTALTESVRDDKYCHFIFTASAYNALFKLYKSVSGEEWAALVPKSLPIFIISGENDPLGGGDGSGPREVYELLRDAEVNDVELKLYKNDRHEILNETDRADVYADVSEFIGRVCDGVVAARVMDATPLFFHHGENDADGIGLGNNDSENIKE